MNRRSCQNHPDREGTCRCHCCRGYFCLDCVDEGPEYYYCKSASCQEAYRQALYEPEPEPEPEREPEPDPEPAEVRPAIRLPRDYRAWIGKSFLWFTKQFGQNTVRSVDAVTPTSEFFPDVYDGSDQAVEKLLDRVSGYMRVDPRRLDFLLFEDRAQVSDLLPVYRSEHEGAAGLFSRSDKDNRLILGLEMSTLQNPEILVAVMAHELSHVHLLADKRLTGEEPDHELLADLLTVFFGLGVFTANASFRFSQWEGGMRYGWSIRRMGYLSEEMWGFALAVFSWIRQDLKPRWSKHLVRNVEHYRKRGVKYLTDGEYTGLPELGRG